LLRVRLGEGKTRGMKIGGEGVFPRPTDGRFHLHNDAQRVLLNGGFAFFAFGASALGVLDSDWIPIGGRLEDAREGENEHLKQNAVDDPFSTLDGFTLTSTKYEVMILLSGEQSLKYSG
jgi:hypothetical protein